MRNTDYNSEPRGVRWMQFVNTQSLDIAKHEHKNNDRICLYGTSGYWTSFEHSAYFLSRIFSNLESFVVNHPEYPFAIVGVSIPDKELKKRMCSSVLNRHGVDYMEFAVSPSTLREYGDWHTRKVKDFKAAVSSF